MVHDGEEALVAFDTYQPNLMLLDLMLPGIDGYQVCREIRARSNTPIIMLSAKGEVFDKVLGLEMGADDYIMKVQYYLGQSSFTYDIYYTLYDQKDNIDKKLARDFYTLIEDEIKNIYNQSQIK